MLLNNFWLHYHTLSSRVWVPIWIPASHSDSSSRFSLCSRWCHHVMLIGCHMTHISILRSDWWSGRGGGQGLKLLPKFLHPHLSRWQTCTSSPSFILCSAVNGQVAMGQCLAPSSIRRWGEEVMWPGLLHLLVWFLSSIEGGEDVMWPGLLHLLVRLLSFPVAKKLSFALVCYFLARQLTVILKVIDVGHYSLGREAFLSWDSWRWTGVSCSEFGVDIAIGVFKLPFTFGCESKYNKIQNFVGYKEKN